VNLEHLLHVNAWVLFGIVGQVAFAMRFIVQWIASERKKESTVPVAFWYLSLVGGVILFVYAFWYRHDLVFSLGPGAGILIYIRNLVLTRRSRQAASAVRGAGAPVV
jgi:lipid-A-disaccharide synthase-like uncharacterized protein